MNCVQPMTPADDGPMFRPEPRLDLRERREDDRATRPEAVARRGILEQRHELGRRNTFAERDDFIGLAAEAARARASGPPDRDDERGERDVSDDDFREAYILSADPQEHRERIAEIERLGATVVCLQNASGKAPLDALRVYGEEVLPALRERAPASARE